MEGMSLGNFTVMALDFITTTESYDTLNRIEIKRNLLCIVFLCVLIPIGTIGNISVLVIFTKHYKPTVFRIFVLCLAGVDLSICAFGIPYAIVEIVFRFAFTSEQPCKIFFTLKYALVISSISLLLGLSMDRFRHVLLPLIQQMTTTTAKFICLITFIMAAIVCWPAYFFARIRNAHCDVSVMSRQQRLYTTVMSSLFLLITISLIIMYICIGVKVYLQKKFRKQFLPTRLKGGPKNKTIVRQDSKVNLIASIVCIVFMLSYLPFLTISNTIGLDNGGKWLCIVQRFIYINSVANPIIYGFLDMRFRCFIQKYVTSAFGMVLRRRRNSGKD